MIKLADVADGRNNSFHLLRLAAACAVLASHAFPLATGDAAREPLREAFGITPGAIAVDLFFLISGLLVTVSLLRRDSAVEFIKARFFRIWPGLTVAICLTVFVLGPAFTRLPIGAYLGATQTWKYLFHNVVLFRGIDYSLPGVFHANPWPAAVNGSLWTLPLEVECYFYLLAVWFVVRKIDTGFGAFKVAGTVIWLLLLVWHVYELTIVSVEDSPARLFFMFSSGAMLYLNGSKVTLSFVGLLTATLFVALCSGHPFMFGAAYSVLLPYAMACLAYLPHGKILAYNRLGDYSYGTYIYAFPVQQAFVSIFPGLTPMSLFAGSLPVTIGFAVLSWHFIEKPAIALMRRRRSGLTPMPSAPAATD